MGGLLREPLGPAMGCPSWRKGWEHACTSGSRGRCGGLSERDGKAKRCRCTQAQDSLQQTHQLRCQSQAGAEGCLLSWARSQPWKETSACQSLPPPHPWGQIIPHPPDNLACVRGRGEELWIAWGWTLETERGWNGQRIWTESSQKRKYKSLLKNLWKMFNFMSHKRKGNPNHSEIPLSPVIGKKSQVWKVVGKAEGQQATPIIVGGIFCWFPPRWGSLATFIKCQPPHLQDLAHGSACTHGAWSVCRWPTAALSGSKLLKTLQCLRQELLTPSRKFYFSINGRRCSCKSKKEAAPYTDPERILGYLKKHKNKSRRVCMMFPSVYKGARGKYIQMCLDVLKSFWEEFSEMGINGCIYLFLLEEGDWADRE